MRQGFAAGAFKFVAAGLILLISCAAEPSNSHRAIARSIGGEQDSGTEPYRTGSVAFKHGGRIIDIAVSEDGRFIASAGKDNAIRVWTLPGGSQESEWSARAFSCMTFCSRSQLSLAEGKTIRVFDLLTKKEVWSLETEHAVCCLASSTDYLIAGGEDGRLAVFGLKDGRLISVSKDHVRPITRVVISVGGKLVASYSADRTLCVWDVSSNGLRLRATTPTPLGVGQPCINILGDSGPILLATEIQDGSELVLWTMQHDSLQRSWARKVEPIRALGVVKDVIVTWDRAGTLRFRTQPQGELGWEKDTGLGEIDTAWITQEGLLAAVPLSGTGICVCRLDVEGKAITPIQSDPVQCRPVVAIAFASENKYAAAFRDATTRYRDLLDPNSLKEINIRGGSLDTAAFSKNLLQLISGRSICDLKQAKVTHWLSPIYDETKAVAVSPDETLIARAEAGKVDLHTMQGECKMKKVVADRMPRTSAILFSQDSKLLAYADDQGVLCVLRVEDGKVLAEMQLRENQLCALQSSRLGNAFVTASRDGTFTWWSWPEARRLHEFRGTPSKEKTIALSNDGLLLVEGDEKGRIVLWEVPTGRMIREMHAHMGPVTAIAISPSSNYIISGGADGTLAIWARCKRSSATLDLTEIELERLWSSLADSKEADEAEVRLLGGSERTTDFLLSKLKRGTPESPRLSELIRSLDSDDHQVRQANLRQIIELGPGVEIHLRKALREITSVEVRSNVETAIEEISRAIAVRQEVLRRVRAIRILRLRVPPERATSLENEFRSEFSTIEMDVLQSRWPTQPASKR